MKNQYFGDIRDLFKYDLIQRIIKEIVSLQKFTFIPMLTKCEPNRGDGNKRGFARAEKDDRPGTNNEELIGFLKKYGAINEVDKDKRDFTKIEDYFKSKSIKVLFHKDEEHEYFEQEQKARDRYFQNIPREYLHRSLVFVDPDIGLEVKTCTEKHLRYEEVRELHDCMDEGSILMIYQHYPRARNKHKEYLPPARANRLKREVRGDLPIWITDNEIIFFLLTKNDELKSQLERIISRYKRDYPERIRIGNVDQNVP
jgi:ribosomal protein S30